MNLLTAQPPVSSPFNSQYNNGYGGLQYKYEAAKIRDIIKTSTETRKIDCDFQTDEDDIDVRACWCN